MVACTQEAPPTTPTLGPVVSTRLADLVPASIESPAPTPESLDWTMGLLQTRVHGGEYRDLALEDLAAMGQGAVLPLAQWARDTSLDNALRQAALELLGELAKNPDGAAASERLLQIASDAPEPWLRAHAAWRLGHSDSDHVLPRLVLRLKYESDPEAFLWVASSLARGGCLAGLAGLTDLAGRKDGRAARAQAELTWIEENLGASATQLQSQWNSSEASALPLAPPSDAQLFEIWSLVEDLSGDTFALRPVDDSRYVLGNLAPWCAREVALALLDEDPFVRLHVAQILERMGPRARETEPQLIAILAEPGVAPAAAEALGSVGSPTCLAPLLAATTPSQPHELRVAAVRGLGDLGLPGALGPMQTLFRELAQPSQSHAQDLRLASARAMVQLGQGTEAAPWLAQQLLDHPRSQDVEETLALWLVRGNEETRLGFSEALIKWQSLADPPASIPNAERAQNRRKARAQGLIESMASLIDA